MSIALIGPLCCSIYIIRLYMTQVSRQKKLIRYVPTHHEILQILMMRSSISLIILLPLFTTRMYARALNTSVFTPPFTIGVSICIDPPSARELNLERVDYRDCIPLLNEILLDPDINHRNKYDATNDYQGRLFGTCSISLRSRLADATDVFWGYQIAIAAAVAIKHCVEDSVDHYGGLAYTSSKLLFFAQVKNLGVRTTAGGNSTAPSFESISAEDLLLPAKNNTNATLLVPNPATATPVCQICQSSYRFLYPVRVLDCYYLFYNILTNPAVEQPVKMRGLSPIRYERYGTCTLQLRGFSAVSADTIKYVALLLAAVSIVQTCMVESGLVLGGAVSVGFRGQYSVRIFNIHEGGIGEVIQVSRVSQLC